MPGSCFFFEENVCRCEDELEPADAAEVEETRRSEQGATPVSEPSALVGSPSAPVDGTALSNRISLQIAGFQDATERGWPSKSACDWRMPATVQGQRSGCGAAYQSGGHARLEAVLTTGRTTVGGLHTSRAYPCDGCEHRAVCEEAERCWRSPLPLNAARVSGEDVSPHKENGYSPACSHRGDDRGRGLARTYCSFRHFAVAVVRRGGAVRSLGLALHLETPASWRPSGVRALASRLLADVEAAVRGRVGGRGLLVGHGRVAVRRRDVVHGRHVEQGSPADRRRAVRFVDVRDRGAASEGAVARGVRDRDAGRRLLGGVAADVEGLRFALTGAAA